MIDEARLRSDSAEIERLLADLRELVAAPVWQRIDGVLRRIVALYGAGLERAIEHARIAGAALPQFDEMLCDDELLASLLVLHGLHPLSTEERVQRLLVKLRLDLGLPDDALVLTGIRDGVAELRAAAPIGGGAMSSRVAEEVLRRAIEATAPEVTELRIEGPRGRTDPALVQIRVRGRT